MVHEYIRMCQIGKQSGIKSLTDSFGIFHDLCIAVVTEETSCTVRFDEMLPQDQVFNHVVQFFLFIQKFRIEFCFQSQMNVYDSLILLSEFSERSMRES